MWKGLTSAPERMAKREHAHWERRDIFWCPEGQLGLQLATRNEITDLWESSVFLPSFYLLLKDREH